MLTEFGLGRRCWCLSHGDNKSYVFGVLVDEENAAILNTSSRTQVDSLRTKWLFMLPILKGVGRRGPETGRNMGCYLDIAVK